jgi:glycosyltransferase involved in cell wall biosynthesis
LQRMGLTELPARLHPKTRVIYQSARPVKNRTPLDSPTFDVIVIGNLRHEKDPFRTARAARLLPSQSRIRVIHVGGSIEKAMEEEALKEASENRRYSWKGPLPYRKTRRLLAACHLLSITSLIEGSSNVLSEALASSVPVVSSKISGIVGTLGEDYPGYFQAGDDEALAKLLYRSETDRSFYSDLKSRCDTISKLVHPDYERQCWKELLEELR